jgi:hypothetical protein
VLLLLPLSPPPNELPPLSPPHDDEPPSLQDEDDPPSLHGDEPPSLQDDESAPLGEDEPLSWWCPCPWKPLSSEKNVGSEYEDESVNDDDESGVL